MIGRNDAQGNSQFDTFTNFDIFVFSTRPQFECLLSDTSEEKLICFTLHVCRCHECESSGQRQAKGEDRCLFLCMCEQMGRDVLHLSLCLCNPLPRGSQ